MWTLVPFVLLLLLVLINGPTQAQALVFSLLPYRLATETAALALTGLALLALARIGARRHR